jgi:hypothetical protein
VPDELLHLGRVRRDQVGVARSLLHRLALGVDHRRDPEALQLVDQVE